MNPDPFDDLLRAYAKQPLPSLPQVTTEVWNEIAQRQRRPYWNGLLPALNWNELFREPRLVIPALALALMAGVLPVTLARSNAEAKLARESLHFEVFSTGSPGTPSTMLDFSVVERSSRLLP
jgi:hypothetical protein